MSEENLLSLGATPDDDITPERYAVAIEQLEEFSRLDLLDIKSLADLSTVTALVRSALRDIIVSAGELDKYSISEVSVPDIEGNPRTGILPGFYNYEHEFVKELIHLSIEQYGDDERLILIKLQKSVVDLRTDEQERLRILNIVKGYVPELINGITDALRGFSPGGDLDQTIHTALMEVIQEAMGGTSKKERSVNANTIINEVIKYLIHRIEEGHGPMREMHVNMPVRKHFDECMPEELKAVDCLNGLGVFSPIDEPDNVLTHQAFFRVFQEIVRDVLPTFPKPFQEKREEAL
ncbi:MAG TPA: hypothetical protein VMR81_06485 [Patescibacteria group bacterium]|nr:hypothetical protein [Patescibacteria group bacterium]